MKRIVREVVSVTTVVTTTELIERWVVADSMPAELPSNASALPAPTEIPSTPPARVPKQKQRRRGRRAQKRGTR
jgi:hypothetical protein